MKAISIKQPWASLVAAGHKRIECRTWRTPYRGPLLVCASKGDYEINDGMIAPGGHALGVVDLVDVRRMTKDDLNAAFLPDEWHKDALAGYAWVIKPMYEIIPFPVKGKLNLFDVPGDEFTRLPDGYGDHCIYWHKAVLGK